MLPPGTLKPSTTSDKWLQFHSKVTTMVNHFTHCYNLGELKWMKTMPDGTKKFYAVGNRKVGNNAVIDRVRSTLTE